MNKLKKLVGDNNKSIINYFENEDKAVEWVNEHIQNPKQFECFELKGIISDCLSREDLKVEPTSKTATEILAELGYEIRKTNSLDELVELGLKDWFQKGDAWCKYEDDGRWNRYDIYVVWKPELKDMKPLQNPKVDDEYSLSLMSIGCVDGQLFQICQRYNHSAKGSADWALGGNLNNLAENLTEAFCKEFGYETIGKIKKFMPDSTIVRHGKYVKYNYEINDVYFCENAVIDAESFKYTDKSRYTILDYFVVDWQEKVVINPSGRDDGFIPELQRALTNGSLKITKVK